MKLGENTPSKGQLCQGLGLHCSNFSDSPWGFLLFLVVFKENSKEPQTNVSSMASKEQKNTLRSQPRFNCTFPTLLWRHTIVPWLLWRHAIFPWLPWRHAIFPWLPWRHAIFPWLPWRHAIKVCYGKQRISSKTYMSMKSQAYS